MVLDDLELEKCEICGEADDELIECRKCGCLFCIYCGNPATELCFFDDYEEEEDC